MYGLACVLEAKFLGHIKQVQCTSFRIIVLPLNQLLPCGTSCGSCTTNQKHLCDSSTHPPQHKPESKIACYKYNGPDHMVRVSE